LLVVATLLFEKGAQWGYSAKQCPKAEVVRVF